MVRLDFYIGILRKYFKEKYQLRWGTLPCIEDHQVMGTTVKEGLGESKLSSTFNSNLSCSVAFNKTIILTVNSGELSWYSEEVSLSVFLSSLCIRIIYALMVKVKGLQS